MKRRELTASDAKNLPPPVPQAVAQPLTRAAIFLVVTINPTAASRGIVRSFCGDLAGAPALSGLPRY